MKKTIATVAILAALIAGAVGAASTATATPAKTKACSGCHHSATAVKVTVTLVSKTATKAKYKVVVSGGKGKAAWAVQRAGKNLAHKLAATGTFTVKRHRTYKVWGVKKGTGSRSKTLAVK
jgi:hypothetical protein